MTEQQDNVEDLLKKINGPGEIDPDLALELLTTLSQQFTQSLMMLMPILPNCNPSNLDELTFFKSILETEDGSKYLFQVVHLEGPKLPMLKPPTPKKEETDDKTKESI